VNGYAVTLGGPLVSLGTNSIGLGNATGESDLTIDDLSGNTIQGKLTLSTASPYFYGNIIIGTTGTPTVEVMSDAALGATTLNGKALPVGSVALGEVELNGGTFQAGAGFSSNRSLFLGGGSTYDTNGFSTTWAGNMLDVQRTLAVINSNQSGNGAGAVSFGTFEVSATATLNINAGSGTGGGAGNSVTFANGIIRDTGGTLILRPTTTGNLGTLALGATNSEDVINGLTSQNTNVNGIVAPWIVVFSGIPTNATPTNPFSFATYGANGYTAATVGSAITNNILTSNKANTVVQSTSITGGTVTGNLQAYALSVQNGTGIALNGNILTLGDGTNPAGLILNGGASISGGTLAFGGSEGVIWIGGLSNNTNTISAQITGSGGLTFSGGMHATDLGTSKSSGLSLVNISTATTETGAIIIDSGAVSLNAVNVFSSSVPGVLLEDTKTSPSPATLDITKNNQFSSLNSVGTNSVVNLSAGAALTIGDSNNENSVLTSTITETGTLAVTGTLGGALGAINKNGTGLVDFSGGAVTLLTNSNVLVNAGALRIGNGVFGTSAANPILVAAGAELQYSGNGGSKFNDPIQGGGDFNLLGGTVQLTGTNTYTGGTNIQIGATLDVTTANLPTGGNISNAGGTLVFDQTTTGTFSGVMSDGAQAGGPTDPNDMACTTVGITCGSTTTLSGTLIKDDSTGGNSGNVTIANVQSYTGMTYVEAGTLTLGAVNTIASSAGVVLGRVGGGATATLALGANNQLAGLADTPSNTDAVQLNGYTLTLAPIAGRSWSYGGSIVDGSASGSLVQNGLGTSILTGTNSYTGATTIDAGTLEVDGSISNSSGITINSGGTLTGHGTIDPPTTMTVMSGGNFAPGTPGSPGTSMTVSGNLAFQAGANYIVQLNPTTSTFANVTGAAALNGANVLAAFQPGAYVSKQQYTILQSGGLGGTTFGPLATVNLPNYSASLSYNTNDVFLNLNAATLGAGSGLTGNQQNVATSLNNFFNSGGTLTPNFASIFAMTGGNLNTALAQLSGESSTATEQASFVMMSSFLGIMVDPSVDGRGGTGGGGAAAFAPEQEASFPPDIALAYASVLTKAPPAPADFAQRWTAWGSSFGGTNKTDGNAAAGTNTVTAQAYGFAGGLDYHVTPGSVIGFALAGSGSNWSTAQNLGTGRSDSFQFGVYGTTRSGPAYLSASAGIANHWFTTDRTAPLGDQLKAKFDRQSYGARLEGGYRYGVATIGVTPYAAVQTQLFHTPSYSEADLNGGGFGLSYAAISATDTRSELGSRFDNLQVVGGMPLILRAKLAWAHDWVSNPSLSATFQALPGANFVVNGAAIPANSALTSAVRNCGSRPIGR
jgi:outer membrane autotransporter protein